MPPFLLCLLFLVVVLLFVSSRFGIDISPLKLQVVDKRENNLVPNWTEDKTIISILNTAKGLS